MDRKVNGPIGILTRQLGVTDGAMSVTLKPGNNAAMSLPSALDQVEPSVFAYRGVSVGAANRLEETQHFFDILRAHNVFDLKMQTGWKNYGTVWIIFGHRTRVVSPGARSSTYPLSNPRTEIPG